MKKIYEVTVDDNGRKEWRMNGELHRESGPAVEMANGGYTWYKNGPIHREDGPAVKRVFIFAEDCDYTAWYFEGKLHRINGPAFEYDDGDKEWYLNGEEFSEERFNQYISLINVPDVYIINGKEVTKKAFERVD